MIFKVIVCGGREYDNATRLYSVLDRLLQKFGDDLVIVTGAQRKWMAGESRFIGADFHAEEWARSREVEYMGFPAKWASLKKRAGFERNNRMANRTNPDGCVAFPGGAGTRMMCGIMVELGITPWCIDWKYESGDVDG